MSVKYYKPQKGYSGAHRLHIFWGVWLVLGVASMLTAGVVHFASEGSIQDFYSSSQRLDIEVLSTKAAFGKLLIFWGFMAAAISAFLRIAVEQGIKRRNSILLRASGVASFGFGVVFFVPIVGAFFSFYGGLDLPRMRQEFFSNFVLTGLFLTALLAALILGHLLASGFTVWETFRKRGIAVRVSRHERIEDADSQDIEAISELFIESVKESGELRHLGPEKQAATLGLDKHLSRCRVYRQKRKVVGFLMDAENPARLRMVHVTHDRQRSKVGTALLKDFEKRAKERRERGPLVSSFGPEYAEFDKFLATRGWRASEEFDASGHRIFKKVI